MKDKIILHSDLNNFFASVECLDRPDLVGKAVAVGGSVEKRHGIILAKNQLAKKYGVKTAEALWQAKQKCPDLIILKPHYDKYVFYSNKVRKIYGNYTDCVETWSIDECSLDVTGSQLIFGNGYKIAQQIKNDVKNQTGLTVSIGVSFNLSFAKLASDIAKPNSIDVINRVNFQNKVWSMPAQVLCGVGNQTLKKLQGVGVFTVGDIAKSDVALLTKALGKAGHWLWVCANGLDSRMVCPDEKRERIKSVSRSTTTPEDMKTKEEIKKTLLFLSEKVSNNLRKEELYGEVIQISVKNQKLAIKEWQKKLACSTRSCENIYKIACELFFENWNMNDPVRAIGVKMTSLVAHESNYQQSFFENYSNFNENEFFERKIDNIKQKFGVNTIYRASLMSFFANNDDEKYIAFQKNSMNFVDK